MVGDRQRDGVHALKNSLGGLRVGDFERIRLVQSHHQLQGIHRIQAQAIRAKELLVVGNVFGCGLEHEILDHHALDFLFKNCAVIH